MNYVTFKIIETRSGEFVLYLHNHARKLVSEQYRSKNLEEVVNRLKGEMKYRKHFMNALGNYMPAINIIENLKGKYADGTSDKFPQDWADPLELYGNYLQELRTPKLDLDKERSDVLALVEKQGSEWIWENRLNLVAERIFIRDF